MHLRLTRQNTLAAQQQELRSALSIYRNAQPDRRDMGKWLAGQHGGMTLTSPY